MLIMESGDTLTVHDFFEKDDSIGYQGGKVGKADLLCIVGGRFVYEFALPKMKQYMVRKEFDGSACGRARQFARKYAKADLDSVDVHDPSIDSTFQEQWEDCFNDELIKMGMDPNEFVDPLAHVKSKGIVSSSIQLLITRTGDSLFTGKDFFMIKEMLGWYGGGSMDPKEVLMVVDRSGQHVIQGRTNQLIKLHPQVVDISPCAQGVIYAKMYWDMAQTVSQIPDLPRHFINDDAFCQCYYLQQARFDRRKRTLRTIGTVLTVVNVANGMQNAVNSALQPFPATQLPSSLPPLPTPP